MNTMHVRFFRFCMFASAMLVLSLALTHRAEAAISVKGTLSLPDDTTKVSGAYLTIHDSGWAVYQSTTSASDGTFSFSDLPSCTCIVQVYANNTSYADPDDRTISVTSGTTYDLGTYQLAQHNVIGRLVLPDGVTPATSIGVALQSADYSIYRYYQTSSTGEFRFRVPSAGSYTLRIYSEFTSGGTTYYAPADQTVSVTDTTQALNVGSVSMKNPNVTGTITDADGTTAISSASISAHTTNWGISRYTQSATNGTFGFYLPTGSFTADVYLPYGTFGGGNNPDPVNFTVVESQTQSLGTVKRAVSNIFFKVTQSDGTTAISGASLSVHNSGWTIYRNATTANDGTASVSLTTAGTYTIETWTNTSESRPDTITLTYTSGNVYYDGTNGSSVIKTQGPALRGIVQRANGAAVQNASAYLYDSTYTNTRWASTDANGAFTLDTVPTGTYTLEINPPWDATDLVAPDKMSVSLARGTTHTAYQASPLVLSTAVKTISGTVTTGVGNVVTDGYVSAWRTDGSGWRQAETNSNGVYSMVVGKGTWSVTVYPKWTNGVSPHWSYNGKSPTSITFAKDNTTAESSSVNFSVEAFTATIKGTVHNPDDTVPSGYHSVSIWRQDGVGNWAQTDSNGAFSVNIAPGTYSVQLYTSSSVYASPEIAPVTIKDGETKDLGTLKLLEKKEKITGSVIDSNNKGLASQNVSCWSKRGSGWASGTTDSSGNYSLNVSPGTWVCNAYSTYYGYGQGADSVKYTPNIEPMEVVVNANETKKNINFTFLINDGSISGVVKDENGNQLTDMRGWVQASPTDTSATWSNIGGEVQNGKFSISLPGGKSYTLGMWTSYGSGYTAKSETSITVPSGGSVTDAVITMVQNDATLSGTLRDSTGTALTDMTGSVSVNCGPASYQWSQITNGTYTVKLPRGTCTVDYWVDTRLGYYKKPLENDGKVTLVSGETKTLDITLQKLDAVISGTVSDPTGKALPNAYISVDTEQGGKKKTSSIYTAYGSSFELGGTSDSDGNFSIKVPSGDYFVTAKTSTSFGYINPRTQEVSVTSVLPASLTFQFLKPDATITGGVYLETSATSLSRFRALNQQSSPAFVSAWSDSGGLVSEFTDTGDFTLNVTKNDAWHLSATYTLNDKIYKSQESVVTVGETGTTTQDLTMGLKRVSLPSAETATFPSNVTKVLELDDGAKVTIPANTLSSSTVDVTVTATPNAQLPEGADTNLALDFGYDLTATYASGANVGQTITTAFLQDITISLPYTDEQLQSAGASEDQLSVKYLDETAGSWKQTDTVIRDPDANTVTVTSNHFTSFALVTASSSAVAPTIAVNGPIDRLTLKKNSVAISGSITDAQATATATLNSGTPKALTVQSNGNFSTTLTGLKVGVNTIVFNASNGAGSAEAVTRTVVYTRARHVNSANRIVVTTRGGSRPMAAIVDTNGKIVKRFALYKTTTSNDIRTVITDLDANGSDEIIAYAGSGTTPQIRVFSSSGTLIRSFLAYNKTFRDGISLVTADMNGDGKQEIIVAPRSGRNVQVRIYSYKGKLMKAFDATPSTFVGGLQLATADLDGNYSAELLVGSISAKTARVRIYSVKGKLTGTVDTFTKSNATRFSLTAADTNGDGKDEIIVASGPGVKGDVRIYGGTGTRKLKKNFFPFGKTYLGGINISAGDITGDGKDDVVVSRMTGPAQIKVYDGNAQQQLVVSALAKGVRGDIRTVTTDITGDGYADIIVVPGVGLKQPVRIYNHKRQLRASFLPFGASFSGGYNVSVNN